MARARILVGGFGEGGTEDRVGPFGPPTSMSPSPLSRCLILLVVMGLSSALAADLDAANPGSASPFSFSGFGTVGGPLTAPDEATFIRDRAQPDGARGAQPAFEVDSRLGVQIGWRPRDDLEGALQLVARYRYDGTYRPEVTWAFAKYALDPDTVLRVGRLGYDVYPLSDSRDVGYSYLWVRPPVDYFGQVHYTHFDGLDLTIARALGDGVLKAKGYLGWLNETIPAPFRSEYRMRGSTLLGGYLDYQDGHWQYRVGLGTMRLAQDLPGYQALAGALRDTGDAGAIALADELKAAGRQFHFVTAGVAYDRGPFQSQLQVRHIDSESRAYLDNTAGYWSTGYRLGSWTPYLVASRIRSDRPASTTGLPVGPPFAALASGVDLAFRTTQIDQDTLSLGARFDLAHSAALKFQIDWIESRTNPSLMWYDTEPGWNGRARVVSLVLDFVF